MSLRPDSRSGCIESCPILKADFLRLAIASVENDNGGLLALINSIIVTKRAVEMERQAGRSAAVCSSVARVSWGKPVFRLARPFTLAESLARWRVQIQSDGTSTQAERRPD
jgi:hypothetical protein